MKTYFVDVYNKGHAYDLYAAETQEGLSRANTIKAIRKRERTGQFIDISEVFAQNLLERKIDPSDNNDSACFYLSLDDGHAYNFENEWWANDYRGPYRWHPTGEGLPVRFDLPRTYDNYLRENA